MRGLETLIPFAIIGGAILLVVGIAFFASQAQKKRAAAMRSLAESLGLPFFPEGDPLLLAELSAFHLFSQGRAKKIRNMIHGDAGDVRVAMFDYQYTVGSGKNAHTHRQTVGCFHVSDIALPEFALRPENIFHKIGGVFGYHDIDFESHPRFSSVYLLRGANEPAIRRLFTPDVLGYFEAHTNCCVEGRGPYYVYYRSGNCLEPAAIRDWMEQGFALLRLFRSSAGAPPIADPDTRA